MEAYMSYNHTKPKIKIQNLGSSWPHRNDTETDKHYFQSTHLPIVLHMCQWTGLALVQIMACRLFGAKPLPEPMLGCFQFYSWEQISEKFKWEFSFKKMHLNLSAKVVTILSEGDELNGISFPVWLNSQMSTPLICTHQQHEAKFYQWVYKTTIEKLVNISNFEIIQP